MTYQHRSSFDTHHHSPRSIATIVAITLVGIASACSENTHLGDTQSLAGASGSASSGTSGSGVGSGVNGSGISTNSSGATGLGATSATGSGATGSGATGSGATGSGATGSDATGSGATGSGAMGSGATGAMGSGATGSGAMGSGATGAVGSGATGSGATSATGSGATGNVGGSTAFVCNLDIQCFRAVECVERCGGPVLQSSCCPCPNGTFDSISCGVGGAPSTGGAGNQGGSTAQGGATSTTSSGGTTTTVPSGVECASDTDCRIEGDCCGCYSFGPGQSSSCPMECLTATTCSGFDPQPAPRCIAGRCTLNRSCDDRKVTCKRMTPQCDAGKLPSLMEGDLCWDGNCIDIVDCSAVTGCDVCKNNGLMCVYDADNDAAHCVSQPVECAAASRCTCNRDLCGTKTCSDTATGISCSG